MITHAITCTGPYAILIMLGIKRVENRCDCPVPVKGRCAISCSKSFTKEEYGNFVQWASRALAPSDFARVPSWADVCDWPGKIVGACAYSVRGKNDLVLSADAPAPQWDEGLDFFWDLSDIACFDTPIPCRGALNFWALAPMLSKAVNSADALARCVGEKISTTEDATEIFRAALPVVGESEGFFVLPLDENRRVLAAPGLVSFGDSVTTIVQPSEVFSAALNAGATSIIVAHNHPSGNPTQSLQDVELTKVLKAFGSAMCIPVLDHLILV